MYENVKHVHVRYRQTKSLYTYTSVNLTINLGNKCMHELKTTVFDQEMQLLDNLGKM